jgi:hypothetical protein
VCHAAIIIRHLIDRGPNNNLEVPYMHMRIGILISLVVSVIGYHTGNSYENETLQCWTTDNNPTLEYTSGDADDDGDVGAWGVYQCRGPQPKACKGSRITLDDASASLLRSGLVQGVTSPVRYTVHLEGNMPFNATISHVNVHSCASGIALCTPFVQNTPGMCRRTAHHCLSYSTRTTSPQPRRPWLWAQRGSTRSSCTLDGSVSTD